MLWSSATELCESFGVEFLFQIDQELFRWINQVLTHSSFDVFFPWITDLHKQFWFKFFSPALLFLIFYSRFEKPRVWNFRAFRLSLSSLLLCVSCLGFSDWFGGKVLKKHFDRPRPAAESSNQAVLRSIAHGKSFPSNHATNMFSLSFFIYFMGFRGSAFFFVIAFLVAYSRVYNGVHYPSDVLAGVFLGLIWGYLFARLGKKIIPLRKSE